jgi:cytochrome P450 family 307 subfamily A
VEKDTVVLFNTHNLNHSEKHWEAPEDFRPERFIVNGKVTKPEYFIPFSTGKRTCIGQRLAQGFAFILIASILQHYDVTSSNLASVRTYPSCVAVPMDTFALTFTPRNAAPVQST